jgi:hypothetical protein
MKLEYINTIYSVFGSVGKGRHPVFVQWDNVLQQIGTGIDIQAGIVQSL